MKYWIIATVALVILGAGLFLLLGRSNEGTAPSGVVTATITYTDDGYAPHEVTVKAGESVRWVNESNMEMWPASAVHPTHSIYPEKDDTNCLGSSFDSCKRIPPGESWEFTFTETGDWKFHDHVRSSRTGIVHVQ